MGGKNHQPCSGYLVLSTKLSRSLSIAYAELEFGNVALEDLILAELTGNESSVDPILKRLSMSTEALVNAAGYCVELRKQMHDENFVDLPTLHTMDLDEVGARFSGLGLVQQDAWNLVSEIMTNGGFSAMLKRIRDDVNRLKRITTMLRMGISQLRMPARQRHVAMILEENKVGNIKPAFAELYTAWSTFNHMFLASSLLSTELWYAHNRNGSLCEEGESQTKVA